jgi:hypothetical protein
MEEQRFRAEVEVGHKDTHVVIAPFDPTAVWASLTPVPTPLEHDPREGNGWRVHGHVAGALFDGYVGRRYGRTFIVLTPAFRGAAGIHAGDTVDVVIAPVG